MRVFVTGATGFIGTAVVGELLAAGHRVLGMARSDRGAAALAAAGADVHRASLDDLASLQRGAADSEAVVHLAFNHDFSNFLANCQADRQVIESLGTVLRGSARPLIITSGVGMGIAAPGKLASEEHFDAHHPNPRVASELAGAAVSAQGVDVRVVRLPQVHDTRKQGLISPAIALARDKGVSAYVGEGTNRFSAAPLLDVARLYRLALEKGVAGARYHAVAEEGVSFRQIAEAIGRGLKVPVVSLSPEAATGHFGWLAMFAGLDLAASSTLTRQRLGWQPIGPGLIEDLDDMDYGAMPQRD